MIAVLYQHEERNLAALQRRFACASERMLLDRTRAALAN
jgi:hypothetical protein